MLGFFWLFAAHFHAQVLTTISSKNNSFDNSIYSLFLCSSSCSLLTFSSSSSEELVSPDTWLWMRRRVMKSSNSILIFAFLWLLVSQSSYPHTLYTHPQSLSFTHSQVCHLGRSFKGCPQESHQSGAISWCLRHRSISLTRAHSALKTEYQLI